MSRIKTDFKQEKILLTIVSKGCDSNFRYAVTYHQANGVKGEKGEGKISLHTFSQGMVQASE